MAEHVTIVVPVYKGERFLEEALRAVQNQTHKDFDVLISLDGPDPACEAICSEFLNDSRFKLVVQPERLGFAGHISWLMSRVTGDFWYYHQQDDVISENYLEALIEHARSHPEAALVYCDIDVFWKTEAALRAKG